VINDITFAYYLNITFKDEDEYYGLRKISLGNLYSVCLRIRYKNNND